MLSPILIMQLASAATAYPVAEPYRLGPEDPRPQLDGELNDDAWTRAAVIDTFEQLFPDPGAPGSERTEVRLAYDDEFFYVAVRAWQARPEASRPRALIQGQTFFSDDRVEVRFDTFNDRRNAYFFQINANGMRREALVGNDYFIEEWDAIWDAAARPTEFGWQGEMRIPFTAMSLDPAAGTWGFNTSRVLPQKGEEHAWSQQDSRLAPATSGYITGMRGVSQGLGIELVPSVSFRVEDDASRGSDAKIEPSLTAFYRLSPALTSALTLNTDFSATEVDDRQVNLSRFSLFFPEKREFFLQDASIFEFANLETNGRPFFSRRIGLGTDGEPLDLDVGVKISGRHGPWNVGALAVRQQAGAPGADQDLFVARVSRNVFDESTLGIVATQGDPLNPRDNRLVGTDFNYRNSQFLPDRALEARLWWQQTDTQGLDRDDQAWGVSLAYPNDRMEWFLDRRHVERNFNPGLGFVNRSGVDETDGQWRFRHRYDSGLLQWLGFRVQGFRADRIEGGLQSERWFLNFLEGQTAGRDFFTLFYGEETEDLLEPFEIFPGIVVPAGRYASPRYGLFVETSQHREWSGVLEWVVGDFLGGTNRFLAPALRWRPNQHFVAQIDYVSADIDLPGGAFTSRIMRVRSDIAFNAEWAWLNFVQYDNVSEEIGFNSRLRWLPQADREYFLVFNDTRLREDGGGFEREHTELTVKLGFNYRF